VSSLLSSISSSLPSLFLSLLMFDVFVVVVGCCPRCHCRRWCCCVLGVVLCIVIVVIVAVHCVVGVVGVVAVWLVVR
jgi:hypothetical protein